MTREDRINEQNKNIVILRKGYGDKNSGRSATDGRRTDNDNR